MKWTISILLSVFLLSNIKAQENPDKVKRIEALKAAFITKKLELSPDEAKVFWPIYDSYQNEVSNLYRKKRKNQAETNDNPKQALDNDIEFEDTIVEVKKKYLKKFSKVLPAQKVLDLYRAEREFREELIKELRERRREKKP